MIYKLEIFPNALLSFFWLYNIYKYFSIIFSGLRFSICFPTEIKQFPEIRCGTFSLCLNICSAFKENMIFFEQERVFKKASSNITNAGDLGLIPGLARSPGEGHGNPLQYSCLENPRDRGAWWATVHGVAKSRTQLSD